MGAVVDYAKTQPVFDGCKSARYSKKDLAAHEEELDTYRAARASIFLLSAAAENRLFLQAGAPPMAGLVFFGICDMS